MRLNFAGVAEEDIVEGIERIGRVIAEQVGLFGTLTGGKPTPMQKVATPEPPEPMADVVQLPRREQRESKQRSS
jgi:2-aminoadipate transaminase